MPSRLLPVCESAHAPAILAWQDAGQAVWELNAAVKGWSPTRLADAALDKATLIALSANAMPEDIERARALGFDDYWTKPIDFRQFLGGLDRLAGAAGP